MEEARQHSALSPNERLYRQIFLIGLLAVVLGIAGQWICGGLWLQEGFAAFLWSRFGNEWIRLRIMTEKRSSWLNLQRANLLLHFILAAGGTYALNAVVIERYLL